MTGAHRTGRHRRRWAARPVLAAAVATVTLLGLAVTGPGAAARDTTPDGSGTTTADPRWRADLPPGVYPVTLLTGDRVRLTVAADRTVRLSLTPEVRPNGDSPSLDWYTSGDGLYVVPSDAEAHLAAGLLDEKLFDVVYLAANGFTDTAGGLPLILEHATGAAPATALRAAGLSGDTVADAVTLDRIDAVAVHVAHDATARVWTAIDRAWTRPAAGRATAPPLEKVWLDRVSTVTLDHSVPQIGTPAARAAGLDGTGVTVAVLDTGVDAGHPDLGNLVAARNFLGEGHTDPADDHGHGTHVATTIAGTGAASDGTYTGVAPGVDLVVGKVCDADGRCPTSAMIAGMQWAAVDQGADVINMSISGCCTDGTDPLVQTVEQLSAETGALFVISAGNDGAAYTVGSPGIADAALTVGAVTDDGRMASFSSRGPRRHDYGLKPEITAPGVDIVAGRAAGTTMGPPVGEHYTTASGTSMAAPHVAGAAAILAQQHPDWDGQQLKQALVASAQDLGHPVYAQGAGRVDVARAISQQVLVRPAVADYRFHAFPPQGPAQTRTLTYTNHTDQPVTLTVTGTLAGTAGEPVPAGAFTLDRPSLTVPAGGTADLTATLDQTVLRSGTYSGAIVATGQDGLRLITPVGVVIGVQQYLLTVTLTARDCDNDVDCAGDDSSFFYGNLDVHQLPDLPGTGHAPTAAGPVRVGFDRAAPGTTVVGDGYRYTVTADGDSLTASLFLPAGRYQLRWRPSWHDTTNRQQYLWAFAPDVVVPGTGAVSLDANQAVKVNHHTPRPTGADGVASSRAWHRILADGTTVSGGGATAFAHGNYWVQLDQPPATGRLLLSHQDIFEAPQVTMTVQAATPVPLDVVYSGYRPRAHYHPTVPVRFPDGTRTLSVVDAGHGSPAEFARVDAAGGLVLLRGDDQSCNVDRELLERAQAAGAAGVLYDAGYCNLPVLMLPLTEVADKPQIPYVSLPRRQAALLSELIAAGPVRIEVTAREVAPYVYIVRSYLDNEIPAAIDHYYPHDQLMTVDAHYHGRADAWYSYNRFLWHPDAGADMSNTYDFAAPVSRTEYIAPVGAQHWQERELYSEGMPGMSMSLTSPIVRVGSFATPGRTTERWNNEPWAPDTSVPQRLAPQVVAAACSGCREGDVFWPVIAVGTGRDDEYAGLVGLTLPTSLDPDDPFAGLALYRDGEPVAPQLFFGPPAFPMPDEVGDYRLVLDLTAVEDSSLTEWEFRSGLTTGGAPAADGHLCLLGLFGLGGQPCRAEPLLFVRYSGLDTDLYNRVKAPGAHAFQVSLHRQPTTTPLPAPAGMTLWVSYDGGDSWQPAKVTGRGQGRYDVKVVHPPANQRASDSVSLRVEAWDTAGNRVRQVVYDAYRLSGPGTGTAPCGSGGCPR